MKMVIVTVVDTEKHIYDGTVNQIPVGEIDVLIDLGDILTDCEKVIEKYINVANRLYAMKNRIQDDDENE